MRLFGCFVDAFTLEGAISRVDEIVSAGVPVQHCALNAAAVVANEDDPRLLSITQGSAFVTADGQSVVWASRLLGRPLPERVAGPDLLIELLVLARKRGWPIYLLGTQQEVLDTLVRRLGNDYPGLRIAGYRNGYFDPAQSDEIIEDIKRCSPALLLVGLPSPMRECWIADHLAELDVPFCMAAGGAFDVLAGHIRRAPEWMQRTGLEWAYRLYCEPAKMWRRYLVGNVRFLGLLLREVLRRDETAAERE